MRTSSFSMTNDLTVYMDDQIFFDKCPYLCAGKGFWTAEQQGRQEAKPEKLHKVSGKR